MNVTVIMYIVSDWTHVGNSIRIYSCILCDFVMIQQFLIVVNKSNSDRYYISSKYKTNLFQ